MSENLIAGLTVASITSLGIVSLVSLVIYFSEKDIEAVWRTKVKNKVGEAEFNMEIKAVDKEKE